MGFYTIADDTSGHAAAIGGGFAFGVWQQSLAAAAFAILLLLMLVLLATHVLAAVRERQDDPHDRPTLWVGILAALAFGIWRDEISAGFFMLGTVWVVAVSVQRAAFVLDQKLNPRES